MIRNYVGKIILIWVVLIIATALLGKVTVAADAGRTTADFLQIGNGARAAGLAGAYTAVSEGAIAAYWNPAGMTSADQSEVALGHFVWYQDITVEQGSFSVPLNDRWSMGGSVTYVNYGDIAGYDVSGTPTGDLTAYDWTIGLSAAYQVTTDFSVGVTGKYIAQKLDSYSADAWAADIGAKYRFNRVAVAASITNLGTNMTFDSESESLPTAGRIGVAVRPFDFAMVASLDVEKRFQGDFVVRQGLEFGFSDRYFLRTGYDYTPDQPSGVSATTLAVGAGIDLDFAEIDYAFTPSDRALAEDLHRFTLVFRF